MSKMTLAGRILGRLKPEPGATVETVWDSKEEKYSSGGFKTYWETLGRISGYQFERISGDPNVDYITYTLGLVKKNASGGLKCCCIGCIEGSRPERRFHDSGLFDEIVVMDIAEGLLAKQHALAVAEGLSNVRYVRADLNGFIFEENSYDLIFAIGTVHHVENLEHFFSQVGKALRPEGLFAMREYVGPDRIQLTDGQLGLANALLARIPAEYRRMPDGHIKEKESRVDRQAVISVDPSESVRSSEIMPVMGRYLETVQYCPTGGTLLHPLLNGIAGNFEKDERGGLLLDALIDIEKRMISAGLLPSDYVFVAAKKR